MPIVTVEMYSGRTQREKDKLAEAITENVVKVLGYKKRRDTNSFHRSTSWELVCRRYSSLNRK